MPRSHMTALRGLSNQATFTVICNVPWTLWFSILWSFCQNPAFISNFQQNSSHSMFWLMTGTFTTAVFLSPKNWPCGPDRTGEAGERGWFWVSGGQGSTQLHLCKEWTVCHRSCEWSTCACACTLLLQMGVCMRVLAHTLGSLVLNNSQPGNGPWSRDPWSISMGDYDIWWHSWRENKEHSTTLFSLESKDVTTSLKFNFCLEVFLQISMLFRTRGIYLQTELFLWLALWILSTHTWNHHGPFCVGCRIKAIFINTCFTINFIQSYYCYSVIMD